MFKEIIEFSKELEKQGALEIAEGKDLPIIKVLFSKKDNILEIKEIKFIDDNKEKENLMKIYISYGIPFGGDNNKNIGGSKGLYSSSFFCFKYNWTLPKGDIKQEIKEAEKVKDEQEKTKQPTDLKNKYLDKFVETLTNKCKMVYKEEKYQEIFGEADNYKDIKIFFDWMKNENNIKEILREILSLNQLLLNKSFIVMFWFDLPNTNTEDLYRYNYECYKKLNAFIQRKRTYKGLCPICQKDNIDLGMPVVFNSLNVKKPFVIHRDKEKQENILTCAECSDYIYKFKTSFLDKYKVKLFPLFIDQELKTEEIKLLDRFKDDEGIGFAGFKKVLYSVSKNYKYDLSFYLVLYNSKNDILAFDYITGYKYYLDFSLINYSFYEREEDINIRNIFHIERELDYLFDNRLINNYFEDKIEDNSGKGFLINLIYKYRMPIFNLIYRNNKNEFLLMNLEEIFLVQVKHKILNTNEYEIRRYINHFISLHTALKNNIYSTEGGKNMEELRILCDKLISSIKDADTQEKLKNDIDRFLETLDDLQKKNVFGFLIGQVVYYILSQSKAGDKTHALLEGFINVGTLGVLAERIKEYFNKYKHEIGFNYWKFNQIMSKVMMFCEDNRNLSFREIETIFYIGYFDTNVFYQKLN